MDPSRRFRPPVPYQRRRSAISRMNASQNKKKGTASVVGGIRGRTYYSRRCKKVETSSFEFLPSELLIEILLRVSADEIFDKVRFVCRDWYHIIHSDAFINAYRENSNLNWGLLLSNRHCEEQPQFLGLRQGRIELSKLNTNIFAPILASCNGLVLTMDHAKLYDVQVVNLATKQFFSSPPSCPRHKVGYCTFGMAYAAASMEYKVVRTYSPPFSKSMFCDILTARVDKKWRSVGLDNLSCGAKKLLLEDPLITQGFMHWTWYWEGTRVLTLNSETEMFTESYVPLFPHPVDDVDHYSYLARRKCKFYVSTGRRLCLFSLCGDWVWEVWEMEGDSGEWIKFLPDMDLEAHTRRVRQMLPCEDHTRLDIYELPGDGLLEPLGWVKYPVLLALKYDSICVVLNLATDEIDFSMELPHPGYYYRAIVHRNTLEWLR